MRIAAHLKVEKYMSVWPNIRELAKRLLGVDTLEPVDLSKIIRDMTPTWPAIPNRLPPAEDDEQIEVLPEYKFVLEAIKEECPAIFVTGRAGTGKSTLVRFLSNKIPNCAVVAPTALAAINVHGSTIHSFFNMPPRILNPDDVFEPWPQIVPVIECLDALVVDEVSMVRPDLVDCINNSLKKSRRDSRPFGGVPLIFIGDLLQLPPVVSDQEAIEYYTDRYRTPYFFSADIFSKVQLIPIELTRVFRQKDQEFVDLLERIRLNDNHRKAVARINRECFRDREPNNAPSLFLVPTNAASKSINTKKLDTLKKTLWKFDAIVEGNFNQNKDQFQAPYRLEIKEGAQILFVKNNRPHWLNGTLGRVVNIKDDLLQIQLLDTGNTVNVERATWDKIRYEYDPAEKRIISRVVGSFKQFPITLGWAITIHKSQGMTLDSVRIDLGGGAFCSGQTYVALSRCKTLKGISLDRPISMRDVKADSTILDFYERLNMLRNENEIQL